MSKRFFEQDINGEFVPVGYEFTGWPSNGIWVVEDGKQNCIYQFNDVPEQPTPALVSYMRHQDDLIDTINKKWENSQLSVRDIAQIACEFFALRAGAMKIGDKIIEN